MNKNTSWVKPLIRSLQLACIGCLSLTNSHTSFAQDLTVSINPADTQQQVSFGGDGKLTIKDWAELNVNTTARKLYGDMQLEVIRVPIFALQPINDNIYDNVITVVRAVQAVNPDVKVFASIANGDGYGTDFHGASKFPASMRGCCEFNVYDLNLTAYAAYLDAFMQRMNDAGITIDYLAPWNEDPGDDSDHRKVFNQMKKLGNTQKVGLERFGLLTSIADVDDVEDVTDIIGSHFYDDARITNPDASWKSLVDASADPVWYTEATRYSTGDNIGLLIAGMNNIFPSIRAGVENVTFYQVVRRFVFANGNELPIKYSGFKNLVNNSNGKVVANTTSTDAEVSVVSFTDQDTLSIHIINKNSTTELARINLESRYRADGRVTRTIWDSNNTEVANSYNLNGNQGWNVVLPANAYIHLEVPLRR